MKMVRTVKRGKKLGQKTVVRVEYLKLVMTKSWTMGVVI